ncbi:TetR/AcrR family transcriptional regulator [Nonomuraea soli]|uniref:AcrR family transcriptional regulator n=1 Tax=Nonomuraea soli TaxID=1032476 RepID=A0A7W0HN27_9ACTN|nr:TetR/AcrR family transcriptional regulator [Nonomuraea soli]MBA2889390.1 AcrR family transcriptional regulator [Nonomuraea soli]
MAPRAQERIFEATLRLLAEHGYDGLTVEGVAKESGVNKTTLYRWWSSKAALARDALVHSELLALDPPDTGSLRGDLIALVEHVIGLLTLPSVRAVVAAMAGAAGNGELAETAKAFFADRFDREQAIFERARERGDLPPGADPMLVVDLLAGAVWTRLLLRQEPLGDAFAARAVDLVLGGSPGSPRPA